MSLVLTRQQSRQLDRELIEGAHIPSLLLMENAGRGAADVIVRQYPQASRLLVVAGPGNNGGDGCVVARRWLTWGKPVTLCLTAERATLSREAAAQLDAFLAVGGEMIAWEEAAFDQALRRSDLIVDALFGTGLSRELRGVHRRVVEQVNAANKTVVALDLPSGLDADTGGVLGVCVRADATVTFGLPKRGCFTYAGGSWAGQLFTVDIGAPLPIDRLQGRVSRQCQRSDVAAVLSRRPRAGHKGDAGHVVVVAGAVGTLGAARLAAHSAFRAGAGLVTVATGQETAAALGTDVWEVMVRAVHSKYGSEPHELGFWVERAHSVVFGPGLGTTDSSTAWLEGVFGQYDGVLVLDADGLTLLAQNPTMRKASKARLVMTPHPGEAARLLQCQPRDVESDRFAAVQELAQRYRAVVVLKGAPSLMASPDELHITPRGHDCLATAGSGDVLSGIVAALGARLSASDAALAGSWLHATAGERLGAGKYAGRGLLARQIADEVPALLAELERGVTLGDAAGPETG